MKTIMFSCLFYLGETMFPLNTEMVPRVGDGIQIDEEISGIVEKVILSTTQEDAYKEIPNRFWTYHVTLSGGIDG